MNHKPYRGTYNLIFGGVQVPHGHAVYVDWFSRTGTDTTDICPVLTCCTCKYMLVNSAMLESHLDQQLGIPQPGDLQEYPPHFSLSPDSELATELNEVRKAV